MKDGGREVMLLFQGALENFEKSFKKGKPPNAPSSRPINPCSRQFSFPRSGVAPRGGGRLCVLVCRGGKGGRKSLKHSIKHKLSLLGNGEGGKIPFFFFCVMMVIYI